MCIKCLKEGGLFMPKSKVRSKPDDIKTDLYEEENDKLWITKNFRETLTYLPKLLLPVQPFDIYVGHFSNSNILRNKIRICIFVPGIDNDIYKYSSILKRLHALSTYDIWTFQHKQTGSHENDQNQSSMLMQSYVDHIEHFLINFYTFYPSINQSKNCEHEFYLIGIGILGSYISENVQNTSLIKAIVFDYNYDSINNNENTNKRVMQHYILDSITTSQPTVTSISLSDFIPIIDNDCNDIVSSETKALMQNSNIYNISPSAVIRNSVSMINEYIRKNFQIQKLKYLFNSIANRVFIYRIIINNIKKTMNNGINISNANTVGTSTESTITTFKVLRMSWYNNWSSETEILNNTNSLNHNKNNLSTIFQLQYLIQYIDLFLSLS